LKNISHNPQTDEKFLIACISRWDTATNILLLPSDLAELSCSALGLRGELPGSSFNLGVLVPHG
jgi:hypothetical protein